MAFRDLGSSVLRAVARWLQSGADWIAARAAARAERPDSESPAPGAPTTPAGGSAGPASRPAGEPPAHWLERVNRGQPPAHWLERVRQGAPELLSPEAREADSMPQEVPVAARGVSRPPSDPPARGEVETSLGPPYRGEASLAPGQAPPGRDEREAGRLDEEPGLRAIGSPPPQAGEQGVERPVAHAAAGGQAGAEGPRRSRRPGRLFRREPAGPAATGAGVGGPMGGQGAGRPARPRRAPEARQDRGRAFEAAPGERAAAGPGKASPASREQEPLSRAGHEARLIEEPAAPAASMPGASATPLGPPYRGEVGPVQVPREPAPPLGSPYGGEVEPVQAPGGAATPFGPPYRGEVEHPDSKVVSWRAGENEPLPAARRAVREPWEALARPAPAGQPGSAYTWPEPPEGRWPALAEDAHPVTEELPAEEWEQRLRAWRRQQRLDREQRGLLWSESLF